MIRPTTPALLSTLLTSVLIPAVTATAAGAQQAQTQAQTDAAQAAADKATADAASQKASAELAQAQTEGQAASQKAALSASVQDELNTCQTLAGFISKLPDPADQAQLFTLVGKQVDKLMGDLGLAYDAPPAPTATTPASGT